VGRTATSVEGARVSENMETRSLEENIWNENAGLFQHKNKNQFLMRKQWHSLKFSKEWCFQDISGI